MPSGALVFGAGTVQWSWGLDSANPIGNTPNTTHAAGDAEPVRRHGRAALRRRSAASSAPPSRPTPPRRPRRSRRRPTARPSPTARRSRSPAPRPTPAAASSPASRSRPTAARPGTWPPAPRAGPTAGTCTARRPPTCACARVRRQRQPPDGERRHRTSTSPARARSGATRTRPAQADSGDTGSTELGVKFTLRRLRRRSPACASTRRPRNTGTHTGSLWTADGTRLAQATFTSETGLRLAEGDVRHAGPGPAGHDLHRLLLRAQRPLLGDQGLHVARRRRPARTASARSTRRRCTRCTTSARSRTASTPTAHQHVPDRLLLGDELLGRRDVHADAGAGRRVERQRHGGGHHVRVGVVERARPPAAPRARYKITPVRRRDGADADDGHRQPAADVDDRHRPHNGHDLPLHRPGDQPRGHGPGVRRSRTRSRRSTPWRRPRRRNVIARPVTASAQVEWTAPAGDGDSPITGYTVTPYIGATAQTPVQAARERDEREGHRPHQRHRLHVPRDRDQRDRHRPGLRRRRTRRPRRTRCSSSARRASSTAQDTGSVELGVKFTADSAARSPACGSTRPRPTPARTPAACGRPPARASRTVTFTQRERDAAGRRRRSRRRSRSPPARRTSPRTSRPAATTRSRPAARAGASTTRRCMRWRGADAERRLRLRRRAAASRPTRYNSGDYGVDVCSPCPSPGAVSNVAAAEAGATSANVDLDRADHGRRRRTSYRITPYDGRDRARADDGRGAGRQEEGRRPDHRPQLPLHRAGAQRQRRRPRLGAVERRHPGRADRARRADRRGRAPGDTKAAQVSWTAPEDDGDSPITGYTVTPYIGAHRPGSGRRVRDARPRARRSPACPTAPPTRSASRRRTRSAPAPTPPRPPAATPGYTLFELRDAGYRRLRRQRARSSWA